MNFEGFNVIIVDEEGNEFEVSLACTCDIPVRKINEEHFECVHCDRACDKENCRNCIEFSTQADIRDKAIYGSV